MNNELILLKAQLEALRTSYLSLLPNLLDSDNRLDDNVWYAKYCLWRVERENLSPYAFQDNIAPLEKEPIDRRRFQLQVLMDVAYIQGHLEAHDIIRRISHDSYDLAMKVYNESKGYEDLMIASINKIY